MTEHTSARPCPLCGSGKQTAVFSLTAERLIAEWKQLFKLDIGGELRDARQVELRECAECRLQFFVPNTLAGSARLYAQLQRFAWYYTPHKWEHDAALEDLDSARQVLEVGCGFGDFLAWLRGERQVEAEGIELNASAVEEAQRRGLAVKLLDAQEAARQCPGRYDAVCSFQVLEHLSDPRSFLEAACALLKPGGRLLLGVPNREGYLKYQFNLLDMPPHHLTRWSSETFAQVQRLFPLKVARVAEEPLAAYHTLDYVEAQCARLTGLGIPGALLRGRLKQLLAGVLRGTRVHRLLRGHTLYASFVRQ